MKRSLTAGLAVGASLAWLGRRRANRPKAAEKSDAELAGEVRESVHRVAGPYLESGAVALQEDADLPPELSVSLEPRSPGTATISLWVFAGTVGVAVGAGNFELWVDADDEWRRDLEEILVAVAEGRYREEISKGWLFERRVLMQFPGTRLGSVHCASLSYGKHEGGPPPVGAFTYAPW